MRLKQNEPWPRFFFKMTVTFIAIAATLLYIQARFSLGIDDQKVRCLTPYKFFIIDKFSAQPRRGELFAFRAMKMEPYHNKGAVTIKQVVGLPGDKVTVLTDKTLINDTIVGPGSSVLSAKLNRPADSFVTEFIVNPGEYFFMGWHPRSYDGRYWGTVASTDLLGAAIAIK